MECSIIIPTKDRPHSLRDAVRSALLALPVGGEIVVVDDGGGILASETLAGSTNENLRVIINPSPGGPSNARNYGVSQSIGRTIFFLDDDDDLLPDYCRRVLENRDIVQNDCTYGHCAPLHMEVDGPPSYQGRAQITGVYGDESGLPSRLAGLGMGFWIRRSAFVEVGGIDASIRVNEDTEFCIRLAAMGHSSFYDSEAGVLLRHDANRNDSDTPSITKSANAIERARGFEYILRKHEKFLAGHPKFRRLLRSRVIKFRSRARETEGFTDFSGTLHSRLDRWFMTAMGGAFLHLSIAIRNRSQRARTDK